MAKLHTLPPEEIIKGLRGILDFYYCRGIPCVRRWPKKSKPTQTQALTCNQVRFRLFQKSLKYWHYSLTNLDRATVPPFSWRWLDYSYKRYMGRVPYAPHWNEPPLKPYKAPCPDPDRHLWLIHDIYYQKTDISPFNRHYAIVCWTNQPQVHLELVMSQFPPIIRPAYKTQRGVKKFCGLEPIGLMFPVTHPGSTSFYAETPSATNAFPFTFTHHPRYRFGYNAFIRSHVGCTLPTQPADSISVGPFLRIPPTELPDFDEPEILFTPVDPLWAAYHPDYYWKGPHHYRTITRAPWWPDIRLPDYDYMHIATSLYVPP